MRDLGQIIRDNGNDNTPAGDSHNLTGRANMTDQLFEDIRRHLKETRHEIDS